MNGTQTGCYLKADDQRIQNGSLWCCRELINFPLNNCGLHYKLALMYQVIELVSI